ncbi:hypothetical protein PENTCL1PPCAC_6618, partial [Pristionchus entomophagus]
GRLDREFPVRSHHGIDEGRSLVKMKRRCRRSHQWRWRGARSIEGVRSTARPRGHLCSRGRRDDVMCGRAGREMRDEGGAGWPGLLLINFPLHTLHRPSHHISTALTSSGITAV